MSNTYYNPWYYYIDKTLIKKKKPCLPGNQIHLHNLNGCYMVHHVEVDGFYILKNRLYIKKPWSEFKCLKGYGESVESKMKKNIKLLLRYNDEIRTNLNSILNLIR
jgi:hypothetical protein